MNTSGILNRSRGVRPFSPPPMERVRSPGPLEDGKRSEEHRSSEQQRSDVHATDQRDGEDGKRDEQSTKTVVHTSTLDAVDGVDERQRERRKDESGQTFFSSSAVDDARQRERGSVETESVEDRNERRERERRWSVTDDDVVSD